MGKDVLIVEEDALDRRCFTALLTSAGYRTRTARNAAEALEAARTACPDLILIDVDHAGAGAAAPLRADRRTASVPLLAATAQTVRRETDRLRAAGWDDCVAKPVQMEPFLDTVCRFMHE